MDQDKEIRYERTCSEAASSEGPRQPYVALEDLEKNGQYMDDSSTTSLEEDDTSDSELATNQDAVQQIIRHDSLARKTLIGAVVLLAILLLLAVTAFFQAIKPHVLSRLSGHGKQDQWGSPSVPSTQFPALDMIYTHPAGAEIDIVVSHYKEPIAAVNGLMAVANRIPYLAERSPRLFLYTKDEDADLEVLKRETNATHVERLDNVGREGHTYLYHMTNRWDQLARQTIFTQARLDRPDVFESRIAASLHANVGMLGLGFDGGVVADCNDPKDTNGWIEQSSVLQQLHRNFTHGSDCTAPILLSFKGQFVASARRIRGVARSLYADMLEAMGSETSWMHDLAGEYLTYHYGKGGSDSMNQPRFGYTLERMWCTMMQCSDPVIAFDCPKKKYALETQRGIGDCQCLDDRKVTPREGQCDYDMELAELWK